MSTLDPAGLAAWRARLGPLGVWASTDGMAVADAGQFARQVRAWGYTTLWHPETLGRDPLVHLGHLADAVGGLVVATGIANIHHRHPGVMRQGALTLAEQTGNRFVLGLGVSHAPLVSGIRHLPYERPLATMRAYLGAYAESMSFAPPPSEPVPVVLAALGPKMIALAGELADGIHPYWTTPEHTAEARRLLGQDKLVCVEQKVVLTEDRDAAHRTIRAALAMYLNFPNYRNNWLRLGFTDAQIDGGDPAFLDALVAWGSPDALRRRIGAHHAAGADHVCVQAIQPDTPGRPDTGALAALAPG